LKFNSKCVVAAGQVLKQFVKKEGSIAIKELDAICTNKPKLNTTARAREREAKFTSFFSMDELLRGAINGRSTDNVKDLETEGPSPWTGPLDPGLERQLQVVEAETQAKKKKKNNRKKKGANNRKEEDARLAELLRQRGFG
jgi:hypothetical protein